MVICYPTPPNQCFCTAWGNVNMNLENCVLTQVLHFWMQYYLQNKYADEWVSECIGFNVPLDT